MPDYRDDVEALTHHLLTSQAEYLFSPEKEKVIAAGWRSGKTRIGCLASVLLSYYIPDNLGFIGRATGKDLKESTIQTFEDVCPPSLFADKPRGFGQYGKEFFIKSIDPRRPSRIFCDYVVDKSAGKSHIAGGNWGFFLLDQGEEVPHKDYLKLLGRLSRGKKTFALSNINQQGHDWWWKEFYSVGDYKFDINKEPHVYFKSIRQAGRLAIIARSEENRESHGGFVPDDYYDTLRRTYPPQWCARYLDGSFDDFSGKILHDYDYTSVHNIIPFPYPEHWPWLVSIDPGGGDPWSIGIWRIDDAGNLIRTKGFYKANVGLRNIYGWLSANAPADRVPRYVLDPENGQVRIQLAEEAGIYAEPALKERQAGLLKMQSYFHVARERALPEWYAQHQPRERWERFKDKGSPCAFIVADESPDFCREAASYVWDENNPNEEKKGLDNHAMDETRYACMARPHPFELPFTSAKRKLEDSLKKKGLDETSIAVAEHHRRIIERIHRPRGADFDDSYDDSTPTFAGDFGW